MKKKTTTKAKIKKTIKRSAKQKVFKFECDFYKRIFGVVPMFENSSCPHFKEFIKIPIGKQCRVTVELI